MMSKKMTDLMAQQKMVEEKIQMLYPHVGVAHKKGNRRHLFSMSYKVGTIHGLCWTITVMYNSRWQLSTFLTGPCERKVKLWYTLLLSGCSTALGICGTTGSLPAPQLSLRSSTTEEDAG